MTCPNTGLCFKLSRSTWPESLGAGEVRRFSPWPEGRGPAPLAAAQGMAGSQLHVRRPELEQVSAMDRHLHASIFVFSNYVKHLGHLGLMLVASMTCIMKLVSGFTKVVERLQVETSKYKLPIINLFFHTTPRSRIQ